LATRPLRLTTSNFIFQLNTCFHSPYVTSSLMKGWVCSLQILLALASAVILRSDSGGHVTTFYCLKFETPPTWRARSPYLYLLRTGWPSYITVPEPILTAYFINPSHQSVRLQVYPFVVARQGLC
jgi:hypothetical protein